MFPPLYPFLNFSYVKDANLVFDFNGNFSDDTVPASGTNTTWDDISGNNRDLTLTGFTGGDGRWIGTGTLTDPYGLKFDGVDDYAARTPVGITIPTTGTLEIWFKADSTGSIVGLSTLGGLTADWGLYIAASGNIGYYDNVHGNHTSSTPVKNDTIKCAQLTWNSTGNTATLYVDGVAVLTSTYTNTGTSGYIVMGWTGAFSFFKGRIFAMRVYTRILTAAELAQNYAAGANS